MIPHPAMDQRDSFRSYVAAFEHDEHNALKQNDDVPDFPLLNGEIVSSQCDHVLLYPPFRENLFGKLYCTNFRICFVPLTRQRRDPCCSRSLIFDDEYQFPSCSIETLLYASYPIVSRVLPKFRKMTSPASQLDIISCIRICTKDFRVWTFDLQRSQFAVNLANNIFHFSRPASLTNFFQLSCGAVHPNSQQNDYKIAFNNRVDWQNEMERCWKMALSHWSFVCFDEQSVNEVPSYPFCVVVPNTLYGARIHESLIPNWNNGRFPVWCWSYTNGSAILRSSKCSNEMRSSELWNIVEHAICRSHPKNRLVSKIDVDISSSKIATSFDRLRELCAIDSMAQFKEREKDWYSLVDNTGWCALVFKCLLEARKVVNLVVDNQRSVVITDEDGLNASVVVCCLAQICADSYYRTIAGLNRLIEKEWIALGYPFGSNMFNCPFTSHLQQNRSSTATFLLFLDALSQLLRLFPVSFEYSQYMLIALWDLSITGLAPGLTCNSIRDRLLLKKTAPTFPLSQYYSSKYCIMFTNALYSTNILFGCEANTRDVIKPPASPLEVEFWTDCYLRWVPAANICEGGSVTHDVALSAVLAYTASAVCNSPSCESVVWRQRLHPAFDAKTITSSFPYSDYSIPSSTSTGAFNGSADLVTLSEKSSVHSLRINLDRGDMAESSSISKKETLNDQACNHQRHMSVSSFFSHGYEHNHLLLDDSMKAAIPHKPKQRQSPPSTAGTLV